MVHNVSEKSATAWLQYLKYIGPALIFAGMARLIFFYSSFGISIVTFLDITEVITSFFDVVVFALIYFIYADLFYFFFKDSEAHNRNSDDVNAIIEETNFWKICFLYFKHLASFLIIYVFLIISMLVFPDTFDFDKFIFDINFLFISSVVIVVVHTEFIRNLRQKAADPGYRMRAVFSFYFLVIVFAIGAYSTYQSRSIKVQKSTIGTIIFFEDGSIHKSDSSNYYIGKTRNYLFTYNQKTGSATVVPIEQVKSIEYPPKK